MRYQVRVWIQACDYRVCRLACASLLAVDFPRLWEGVRKDVGRGLRRERSISVFLGGTFTHSSGQTSFTIKGMFCERSHGSLWSLPSHTVCTHVEGREVCGSIKLSQLAEGDDCPQWKLNLLQAKSVVRMALLLLELNLAREDYVLCNSILCPPPLPLTLHPPGQWLSNSKADFFFPV